MHQGDILLSNQVTQINKTKMGVLQVFPKQKNKTKNHTSTVNLV